MFPKSATQNTVIALRNDIQRFGDEVLEFFNVCYFSLLLDTQLDGLIESNLDSLWLKRFI